MENFPIKVMAACYEKKRRKVLLPPSNVSPAISQLVHIRLHDVFRLLSAGFKVVRTISCKTSKISQDFVVETDEIFFVCKN